MTTLEHQQRAGLEAHKPRLMTCSWPGCTEQIIGTNYKQFCPYHKSIRRKSRKKREPGHYIRNDSWLCTFDPDGDFTGKLITNLEIHEMIKHNTFSRGTILKRAGEEIVI